MIARLPPSTQALYSELLELCLHAEAERITGGGEGGSFASKEIRGRRYWYLQRSFGGQNRQHYLGPESEALSAWIERVRERRADGLADRQRAVELCAMLAAAGAVRESAAVTSVLSLLADGGLFARGGVLVGTVAFAVHGTLLGVRFDGQRVRTEDIDAAHDPALAVAIAPGQERVDLAAALAASPLGFLPVPELDPRHPSSSFKVRGRQLRVDFLTPSRARPTRGPVALREIGVAAQPLPFLDYLLAGAVQAVVIGPSPVLVNVPDPARAAVHKLWTSGERPVAQASKAAKDLAQAAALFEVLLEDRPGDVALAWRALAPHPSRKVAVERIATRLPAPTRAALGELVAAVRL